jgi:hypothetical protein
VCGPRVWQARRVARMCAAAGLDRDQARWVDSVTTPYAGVLPWGRFESLVEAKIIEADPEAAEERPAAAAMERFVRTGQSDEYGLKTLVARANAGEIVFFVAMVDRLAEILAARGDTDPAGVRRSKAIGILATPARAVLLLAEAGADASPASDDVGASDASDDVDAGEVTDDLHAQAHARAVARRLAPRLEEWLRGLDSRRLLPEATFYLHLSEAALAGHRAVARVEGLGPVTVPQLVEFLGHTNVRAAGVVDVAGQAPVDGYEAPVRVVEALHLRHPACDSPWSENLSRRKDTEHVVPFVPPQRGGPPGQTRMDNLTRLARFPHRVKTHGRWRLRQRAPGVLEWRSPHGYRYLVDHTGTRPLGRGPDDPA